MTKNQLDTQETGIEIIMTPTNINIINILVSYNRNKENN